MENHVEESKNPFISIPEAAKFLGVGYGTVQHIIFRRKTLPYYSFGGRYRILRKDFEEWFLKQRHEAEQEESLPRKLKKSKSK